MTYTEQEVQAADELDDIFPGTGAVTTAWEKWKQLLQEPPRPKTVKGE